MDIIQSESSGNVRSSLSQLFNVRPVASPCRQRHNHNSTT